MRRQRSDSRRASERPAEAADVASQPSASRTATTVDSGTATYSPRQSQYSVAPPQAVARATRLGESSVTSCPLPSFRLAMRPRSSPLELSGQGEEVSVAG